MLGLAGPVYAQAGPERVNFNVPRVLAWAIEVVKDAESRRATVWGCVDEPHGLFSVVMVSGGG